MLEDSDVTLTYDYLSRDEKMVLHRLFEIDALTNVETVAARYFSDDDHTAKVRVRNALRRLKKHGWVIPLDVGLFRIAGPVKKWMAEQEIAKPGQNRTRAVRSDIIPKHIRKITERREHVVKNSKKRRAKKQASKPKEKVVENHKLNVKKKTGKKKRKRSNRIILDIEI